MLTFVWAGEGAGVGRRRWLVAMADRVLRHPSLYTHGRIDDDSENYTVEGVIL